MKYLLFSLLLILTACDNNSNESCGCTKFDENEVINDYPGPGFHAIVQDNSPSQNCYISLRIYSQHKNNFVVVTCQSIDKFIQNKNHDKNN